MHARDMATLVCLRDLAFWVYNVVTWVDIIGFGIAWLAVRCFRHMDQFRSPWRQVHWMWVRLLGRRVGDQRIWPNWVFCFTPLAGRVPIYLAAA